MKREEVLGLTLQQRVQLIAQGLLLFAWWFKLDEGSTLPPDFVASLSPTPAPASGSGQ
jgi:hypothetical protein